MKKRKFLNIFCVSLFCFFIGSFKVGAITCEYPFSYTDEKQNVINATIVVKERLVFSGGSTSDIFTEIIDVRGMKKHNNTPGLIYWEPSNSEHTFVFGKNRGQRIQLDWQKNAETSYAENFVNNTDGTRTCPDIYYRVLYGEHGGATQIHIYLGYSKSDTYNHLLTSSTKLGSSNNQGENNSGSTGDDDNDEEENNDTKEGCSMIHPDVIKILKNIFRLIQIAGPILAIVLGMADFVGAVLSGEADAMKKASKKFITRLIAAALLFLIPVLLEFLLQFIEYQDSMCID